MTIDCAVEKANPVTLKDDMTAGLHDYKTTGLLSPNYLFEVHFSGGV